MKPKLILCLALLITPLPVRAVWSDLSAHFEREDYWSLHAIYLARITDMTNLSTVKNPYLTSFSPVKIISGSVDLTNRSIQSSSNPDIEMADEGECPVGFPHGVISGLEILVSENTEYHQTTVVKVMHFPDDQALLVVLERIARLRAEPAFQSLLAGATSEFDLLSEYCLNRLLALPGQTIPDQEINKLQSLADDGERPAVLRIAAKETALRFSGKPESDPNEAEYKWLRGLIQAASQRINPGGARLGHFDQTAPLITKLFTFKNKQEETADYILRLLGDEKISPSLRGAASSTLSSWDQQVFNFQSPDSRFDRMFNTYIGLLKDENPDLRIDGMSMLFDRTITIMATCSPPDRAREYGRKAVQALQKAITVETNSQVLRYFTSRMDMYKSAHRE